MQVLTANPMHFLPCSVLYLQPLQFMVLNPSLNHSPTNSLSWKTSGPSSLPSLRFTSSRRGSRNPRLCNCPFLGQGFGQGLGPGLPSMWSRTFPLNHGSSIVIPAKHLCLSTEACPRRWQIGIPAPLPGYSDAACRAECLPVQTR